MAIQTRPTQKQSNVLHVVIAAGAAAAIAGAAIFPLSGSGVGSETTDNNWPLSSSAGLLSNADMRFAEDMALHEALTDAVFGPLIPSQASVIADAIAEHDALMEAFLVGTAVSGTVLAPSPTP